MNTEYDNRQIKKMKQQLNLFKQGKLLLGGLISNLEFLLNAIESIDDKWQEEIHQEIIILEEVYAVNLDSGASELDELGVSLVHESIKKLSSYLEEIDN